MEAGLGLRRAIQGISTQDMRAVAINFAVHRVRSRLDPLGLGATSIRGMGREALGAHLLDVCCRDADAAAMLRMVLDEYVSPRDRPA
jgi:hypothetical protein